MQIYNSLTRKKEEFRPIHEGEVGIYACGPTVYNYFHIGNARPFITFDVLRRQLEREGYKANNHTWTYSTPSWSPYVYTTCNDGCTISSTIEANKIIGSSIDNNNITLNTATADLNTDLKFSTNWK